MAKNHGFGDAGSNPVGRTKDSVGPGGQLVLKTRMMCQKHRGSIPPLSAKRKDKT